MRVARNNLEGEDGSMKRKRRSVVRWIRSGVLSENLTEHPDSTLDSHVIDENDNDVDPFGGTFHTVATLPNGNDHLEALCGNLTLV